MAIAIVQNDKVIYAKGFGARNSKNEPVTPETIFSIASLTNHSQLHCSRYKSMKENILGIQKSLIFILHSNIYDAKATKEFTVKDLIALHSGLPAHTGDFQAFLGYDQNHILNSLQMINLLANFITKYAYQNALLIVCAKNY